MDCGLNAGPWRERCFGLFFGFFCFARVRASSTVGVGASADILCFRGAGAEASLAFKGGGAGASLALEEVGGGAGARLPFWEMANKINYSEATVTVAALLLLLFFFHIAEAEAKEKLGREKISHLHFYFHDIVSGKNVTAVKVASAPTTNSSATLFGTVMVMDDWLTEGPEATSKMVGTAQAIYVSLSQEKFHYWWPPPLFSRAASTMAAPLLLQFYFPMIEFCVLCRLRNAYPVDLTDHCILNLLGFQKPFICIFCLL